MAADAGIGDSRPSDGIQFADAVLALEDDSALTTTEHAADGEERWITLGVDAPGRIWLWSIRGGRVA